uniref:Cadherin domain-containing protein n=1 Tax=Anas platyrhynchos TaxID=8839 RepID=A0A8B9SLD5_ANAPL
MESISLQRPAWKWQVLSLFSLCGWGWVSGQIRYSVVEESEVGTVVGNMAQDLGLKVEELPGRRLRLGSEENLRHFAVRLDTGALVVSERLDRELGRWTLRNHPSTRSMCEPVMVVGGGCQRQPPGGANGVVSLEISPNVPFAIRSLQNHYSLVTREYLDRESTLQYTVDLTAQDGGSPALTTRLTLLLNISDVNDNPPRFLQPSYDAFLPENSPPGSLLCTVSASDPDDGDNSRLVYSIEGGHVQGAPASSYVHINPDNGNLYAQRPFDFELLQVLPVSVAVRDSGSPPLRANVTVYIFVLDQNDHPPTILHPASDGDVPAPQRVPLSAPPGYLV